MVVLLINPNRLRPRIPPIGLDYIYDGLTERAHDVLYFDFGTQAPGDLKHLIRKYNPDIIGISVRNLDDVTITRKQEFITPLQKLVQSLRRLSTAKIVLGGIGFTFMPRELMTATGADFGITGDGEKTLPTLLDDLEIPDKIPGLFYSVSGKVLQTAPLKSAFHALDGIPASKRALVDYRRYNEFGSAANVQTQRGCDRRCIFCPEPHASGQTVRLRAPESVIAELEILSSRGFRDRIFMVDSEFNANSDHAFSISKAILDSGMKLNWLCYMTPRKVDKDLLTVMKKAGCILVIWSLETAAEKMLCNLRKDFEISDIFKVSRFCDEVNLPYYHSLLFGGPGENLQTIDETYANISKTHAIIIGINAGIRIYPNTEMFEVAVREGEITETDNLLYPVYYKESLVKKRFLPYIRRKCSHMGNVAMIGLPLDKKYYEALRPYFHLIK